MEVAIYKVGKMKINGKMARGLKWPQVKSGPQNRILDMFGPSFHLGDHSPAISGLRPSSICFPVFPVFLCQANFSFCEWPPPSRVLISVESETHADHAPGLWFHKLISSYRSIQHDYTESCCQKNWFPLQRQIRGNSSRKSLTTDTDSRSWIRIALIFFSSLFGEKQGKPRRKQGYFLSSPENAWEMKEKRLKKQGIPCKRKKQGSRKARKTRLG